MASVFLLLALVAGCFVCVQFGAIALELTGMDRPKARFQALSAFTNSGFTTREAEEVMRFPVRRRIVSFLMVLGYVGLATSIGTLARSFVQRTFAQTAAQVGILGGAVLVFYLAGKWRGLTRRIGTALRRWLMRRHTFDAPSAEEMLQVYEGFGVVRVALEPDSDLLGKPLRDLRLPARKIQILAIHRGTEWIAVPSADDVLGAGDQLLCYGDERAIENLFAAHVAPPELATP